MTRSFVTEPERSRGQATKRSHQWTAPAEPTVSRTPDREVAVTGWRLLQGAAITGLLGAVTMFLVLAAFAVGQGRGPGYPVRAVQGMISGRRVIPDHPVGSVRDLSMLDYLVGPAAFVLPALVAALATLWWAVRRHGGDVSARSVATAAFASTWSLFAVLVLAVGYQEADSHLQRISSGYGVRALGLPAWVVGHLAYATFLTLCLEPITRALSTRRRGTWEPLRGESRTMPGDRASR